ncbi:metallophosphoesterase [Methanobacterium paludis]|uniref:Phosphoesterase n=1 Tax=Methanobacterium paludis (strain DSM 25820 / JCM 18151 / SWAN1) TaxID=868131 RepID=F6D7W4_METPW|nr:metallophosphoesterase [Methanobacterium paludis]AEG17802.1 phosphoesterase [Methanobacterium paludis]
MKNNEIYGAEIVDLALVIRNNLIISDLHLGYEEALNAEGIMVPKFQYQKIIARLEKIISQTDCSRVIVTGDLKHEFGKITRQEWGETLNFIEFLKKHFEEVVLIKGNHDNFTKFIAKKTGLAVYDSFSTGDFLLLHGDKVPVNVEKISENTIIIGHEHPCIGIRSGERLEKIKCFLNGGFKGKNLVVMPSFNFITEGSDVLHEKPLSPFLKNNIINDFEVFGVENFEILYFGKIKDIIRVKEKFY